MNTPATTTNINSSAPPAAAPVVSDDSESEEDESMEQQPERTVVRFSDSPQVHEIPSRESFSPEEIKGMTKDDYQAIRREAYATIQLHREGKVLQGDLQHCMRGLEGRTTEGFSLVKSNRIRASNSVILEQDRQDELGICDAALLAEVYQSASLYCRCVAYAQGLMDAQEVISDLLSAPGVNANGTPNGKVEVTFNQALAYSVQVHLLGSVANTNGPEDMAVEDPSQLQGVPQKDSSEAMDTDMEWTAVEA